MPLFIMRQHVFPLLLLIVMALTGVARAETDKSIETYVLPNGLRVILAPITTTRNVAVVTTYGVGSADEAPGRSGFAHLFEHLMFEGTKAIPQFDKVISAAGGNNNAFTELDRTTYLITGPAESLPVFLRTDADRMANLANAVTQEALDNQRQIVLNEMRENVLDRPGGSAQEQAIASLYQADHPYAHSTIGSIADLNQAKLEDVIAFHRTWYVPSNAILTISGGFDVAQAKSWINQTFALVPQSDVSPRADVPPVIGNPARLTFKDAVPAGSIAFNWTTSAGKTRETTVLMLLSQVLSTGENSLADQLVLKQNIASYAGVGARGGRYSGQFSMVAAAAEGKTLESLEAALRAEWLELQKRGISPAALKTVLADLETSYSLPPTDSLNHAIMLSRFAEFGDPREYKSELSVFQSVSIEELNKALRGFDLAVAQNVIVEKGPRNTVYPPVITESTGESVSPTFAPRADVVIPDIAIAQAKALQLPATTELKLANGAGLTVFAMPDAAEIALSIIVPGGRLDAPAGLASNAMAVNERGAGDETLVQRDQRLQELGLSISGYASLRNSGISASAPAMKFETLADEVAKAIVSPRFGDSEWRASLDGAAQNLTRLETQIDYQSSRAVRKLLYPVDTPENRNATPEAIRALPVKDAEQLFKALMQPESAEVHVAGNLLPEQVKAILDRAFANWKSIETKLALGKPSAVAFRSATETFVMPDTTQSAISISIPAPDEGTREAVAFSFISDILGSGTDGRLNRVLREEKGWSYGIGAGTGGNKGQNNNFLNIQTSVQADKTKPSLDVINDIIKALASDPITQDELDMVRRARLSGYASATDSAQSMIGLATQNALAGYKPSDLQPNLDLLSTITLEEVNVQAAIIAKSPMAIGLAGTEAAVK